MLFKEIPSICLIALLNRTTKEFYLLHSIAMLAQLGNQMQRARKGAHPDAKLNEWSSSGQLEFEVLTTWNDSVMDDCRLPLLMAYEYNDWIRQLSEAGYTHLRGKHNPGIFKLKKLVVKEFRRRKGEFNPNKAPVMCYVVAQSRRNDKHVLGVFENVSEADAFIETSFNGKIQGIPIVFADNDLTRQYHKEIGIMLVDCYKFLRY